MFLDVLGFFLRNISIYTFQFAVYKVFYYRILYKKQNANVTILIKT